MTRALGIAFVALLTGAGVAEAHAPSGNAGAGLSAFFSERSYRPGASALLRIDSGGANAALSLQVFQAGGEAAPWSVSAGHDVVVTGVPVTAPIETRRRAIAIRVGKWRSGVYFARLSAPGGGPDYAPFIVGPPRLGASRVLVVEPTNTWQAYNFEGGDSWYLNPAVHVIDLMRPYLGDGLPPHFRDYDLGFLRWYWQSGAHADFLSDDDLERFVSGAQLRRLYDLIVFPGHEEYVTPHVFSLIDQYRDDGGNLAFLSADNFFYEVTRSGHDLVGRTRWRDLGRPEASLVGAEYAGWNERLFRNHPFEVSDTAAAPWLFAGTGLRDGSRFGLYGIEIDQRAAASPPGVEVLARISNDFGPGASAEMTYYRRGRAGVFDAGVLNFGATADWPRVSRLVDNLWRHLAPRSPLGG